MSKRKRSRKRRSKRADPLNRICPCGSGKKYRDCHGATETSFSIETHNRPEVVDYHLTSPDGVNWTRKPGNLLFMIGGRRPEDTDPTVESLISSFMSRCEAADHSEVRQKLVDLRHKLYAVSYHLEAIGAEIEKRVSEFEKEYHAGSGAHLEIENPRLVYDTEAFLFQVKSALDVLVQVIGRVVPPLSSMHSFRARNIEGEEQAGASVIRALRLNGFPDLGDLFELNRSAWIQELVAMRDTITHYSALRDFHCFIEEPYRGGKTVMIHYPTMPSGRRVDAYCKRANADLLQLVKKSLSLCPAPLSDNL